MAAALTPSDRALNATDGKANFQRLTRLLMSGGITLLRKAFDFIHPPADLPIQLGDSTIKTRLQRLRDRNVLTRLEWNQLYPSPGVYGKSKDFDITLLFKLFRNIGSLTPPGTGWDSLPSATDLSFEADLARIKCRRNDVYAHTTTMEISDPEFVDLWREISDAFLRIAGTINNVERLWWQSSIDAFLHDPLTPDEARHIAELDSWYKNDMVVKDELIKFQSEMLKEMEKMNIEQQERFNILIHIITETIKPCKCGSPDSVTPGHFPNSPQLQETQLPPESVCVLISSQESQTEGAAAGQSTHMELQANRQTPSTAFDFWHVVFSVKKSLDRLIEHLRKVLGLDVVDSRLGSLLITVTCSSLEVLERLWEDYSSGHLSEVVQEKLVTAEVLRELNVSEVTLKTIIMEDEYENLKQFLKYRSGTLAELDVSVMTPEISSWEEYDRPLDSIGNLAELDVSVVTPEIRGWKKYDRLLDSIVHSRRSSKDSGSSSACGEFLSDSDDENEGKSSVHKKRRIQERLPFVFEPSLLKRSLPFSLRHDLVKLLDSPSLSPNWRTLSEELGLRMGQIQWLEQLPPGLSPTETLLRMMEAQNYPLSELAKTLRKLGGDDVASMIDTHQSS